jgi:arabinose-5-phosphate isomerase
MTETSPGSYTGLIISAAPPGSVIIAPMERKRYSRDEILGIARSVIENETSAVQGLIPTLGEDFVRAVELIIACKGRIVLTGIGKSGYIAQKIAATLTSTGTLASFLHSAEGFHGDLGLVSRDDVVIAISHSGETAEILDLLPVLSHLNIPVIAVTGNPGSELARRATVHLHIGDVRESDPDNLVPTASSLATLALGDALTVVLMSLKEFRKEDYAIIHPRGMLGKRLTLKVTDLLKGETTNPMVGADDSFRAALKAITRYKLGGVSIVDAEGKLAGILTDGDVRRIMERWEGTVEELMNARSSELMTASPTVIGDIALASQALSTMENHQPRPIFLLPVVDGDGKPVGMIHLHDLVQAGFKTSLDEVNH